MRTRERMKKDKKKEKNRATNQIRDRLFSFDFVFHCRLNLPFSLTLSLAPRAQWINTLTQQGATGIVPGSLQSRNAIVDISLENHRNVKIISRTNGLPIGLPIRYRHKFWLSWFLMLLLLFAVVIVIIVVYFLFVRLFVCLFICSFHSIESMTMLCFVVQVLGKATRSDQLNGFLLYCIFLFHDISPSLLSLL